MKKKTTQNILLALGAGLAAWFVFKPKTAKAAPARGGELPAVDDDDKSPPTAPVEPTPVKRNAPPMGIPYDQALLQGTTKVRSSVQLFNNAVEAAMDLGPDWAGPPPIDASDAEIQAGKDKIGVPSGRTPASFIADQGFFSQFPAVKIPAPENEGSGWSSYKKLWNALWADAKSRLLKGTNK